MKRFSVLIQAHSDSKLAQLAYRYCTALAQSQHRLETVLFHADGVYHSQLDAALFSKWLALSTNHDIPLHVCHSDLDERNLIVNPGQAFIASSLSPFIMSAEEHSNRIIHFGGTHE